ncbi:hypothetical protein Tco_0193966 [Tanacetum coccineum]
MADLPTSLDRVPASPDHAPALPDHIPGAHGPEPAFPDHVVDFPDADLEVEIEEGPKDDQDMDIDEEDPEEDQVINFEDDDDEVQEFQHDTYEVGGLSLATPEAPHLVGHPLSVVAFRDAAPPEARSFTHYTRRTLSLVRRVDGLSDDRVADSIAISELQPRMATIEERVQTLVEDGEFVQDVLDVVDTEIAELKDRVDDYPRG